MHTQCFMIGLTVHQAFILVGMIIRLNFQSVYVVRIPTYQKQETLGTPAECPRTQLNSYTIYLEIASDFKDKGLSPIRLASLPSHTSHKSRFLPGLLTNQLYIRSFLIPPPHKRGCSYLLQGHVVTINE